jgi:hypothetical protein
VLAYSHHFDANLVIILYSGKLLYVFLSLGDNNSPFFVKKPHFSASAAPPTQGHYLKALSQGHYHKSFSKIIKGARLRSLAPFC